MMSHDDYRSPLAVLGRSVMHEIAALAADLEELRARGDRLGVDVRVGIHKVPPVVLDEISGSFDLEVREHRYTPEEIAEDPFREPFRCASLGAVNLFSPLAETEVGS